MIFATMKMLFMSFLSCLVPIFTAVLKAPNFLSKIAFIILQGVRPLPQLVFEGCHILAHRDWRKKRTERGKEREKIDQGYQTR